MLLNPMRLINPASIGKRNIRGFGLPSCANGVMVPISMKPNPKFESSLYNLASLSKPAAKPTGFGNFIPKTVRSNRLSFFTNIQRIIDFMPGIDCENLIN